MFASLLRGTLLFSTFLAIFSVGPQGAFASPTSGFVKGSSKGVSRYLRASGFLSVSSRRNSLIPNLRLQSVYSVGRGLVRTSASRSQDFFTPSRSPTLVKGLSQVTVYVACKSHYRSNGTFYGGHSSVTCHYSAFRVFRVKCVAFRLRYEYRLRGVAFCLL